MSGGGPDAAPHLDALAANLLAQGRAEEAADLLVRALEAAAMDAEAGGDAAADGQRRLQALADLWRKQVTPAPGSVGGTISRSFLCHCGAHSAG